MNSTMKKIKNILVNDPNSDLMVCLKKASRKQAEKDNGRIN